MNSRHRWLLALGAAALADAAAANEVQTYSYDELGRLVAVQYSGTVNNGQAHSLCYDPAGNRTKYKSDASGATLTTCPTGGGGGGGDPDPDPTNQPPVANPDTLSVPRCESRSKDVVANDTDPEGNLPLTVIAVDHPWASVASSTTVSVQAPDSSGSFVVHYTVRDSLGATATGNLSVTITGTVCS